MNKTKNIKIILGISYILIISIFLWFFFQNFSIQDFTSYELIKANRDSLEGIKNNNLILSSIIFFFGTILWVLLLGFGSPILIISGILFGQLLGTLISVISISVGALILYSIGNFFFRDLVKSILEKKFEKYIQLFQKNEFFYFFIFRFIGGLGVPFGLQNLIPILFGMKKINYFLASFFGFIPSMFIMNTIGAGLNSYVEQAQSFSVVDLMFTPEIYFPIILFGGLMIISLLVKKKFFDNAN